jgi:hypothetical protein
MTGGRGHDDGDVVSLRLASSFVARAELSGVEVLGSSTSAARVVTVSWTSRKLGSDLCVTGEDGEARS